jgi:hypothetical protein
LRLGKLAVPRDLVEDPAMVGHVTYMTHPNDAGLIYHSGLLQVQV